MSEWMNEWMKYGWMSEWINNLQNSLVDEATQDERHVVVNQVQPGNIG